MMNPVINFSIKLIIALGVVFASHIFILTLIKEPIFNNLIIESYLINIVLAVFIYGILYYFRIKYLDMLGFIFMAGSFLKFGCYYIFFYPQFKQDGEIIGLEATSFIVPYVFCLIFETFYLVKLLNKGI